MFYRDIFPVLRNPSVANDLYDLLYNAAKEIPQVECVVGLEARGFLFGPILAQRLNVPFVPLRKAGKLPGVTEKISYSLEYGSVSIFLDTHTSIMNCHSILYLIINFIF